MSFASIVEAIGSSLAKLTPADLLDANQPFFFEKLLAQKVDLHQISSDLLNTLGQEPLDEFFDSRGAEGLPMDLRLFDYLLHLIPRHCTLSDNKVQFAAESALADLEAFKEFVRTKTVPYIASFRLANIDLDDEVIFDESFSLRPIEPWLIDHRYPVFEGITNPPVSTRKSWHSHRVEAVFALIGGPSDVSGLNQEDDLLEFLDQLFIVAGVPDHTRPRATHLYIDSPLDRHTLLLYGGPLLPMPVKLSDDHVAKLRRTYGLMKVAGNDRILEAAIDRYILGRRRSTYHPNRINRPHWDKIVDYVIAMEALFLTVNGNSAGQELSYRFSLNGVFLLRQIDSRDEFKLFSALRSLYQLRSSVVHASDNSNITSQADRFIRALDITCPADAIPVQRLILVSSTLEKWITELFYLLQQIEVGERPYRKSAGWEQLIFGRAAPSTTTPAAPNSDDSAHAP